MRPLLLVLLALGVLSCGLRTQTPANCDAVTLRRGVGAAGSHVSTCSDTACGDGQNPPLGGKHCATPARCLKHSDVQPRCAWIHNLEHGHLVLAYNCPGGCPEVVAALERIYDAAPKASSGVPRVLITPDPQLPSRVGAMVWDYGVLLDEVDTAAIECVMARQDEAAPEPGLACAP
jgi:hypothetical protein